MIEVRRTIQPDALIDNINCILQPVQQGIVIAHISFRNAGQGTITAVKFQANGFDVFGAPVKADGQNSFFLAVQDIILGPNAERCTYHSAGKRHTEHPPHALPYPLQ